MKINKINNLKIYQFNNLLRFKNILHFVTTRETGISPGPFKSLNLGYNSGDNLNNVKENWNILKEGLGLYKTEVLTLKQIHSEKIIVINNQKSEYKNRELVGDAIITNKRDLLIAVLVADCVPIIMYDPVKSILSVVHAGWKGTSLEIAKKTVNKMIKTFSSKPKDIIAAIGPSIGPCCYEVKNDVKKYFMGYKNSLIIKSNSYYINLWEINRSQLIECGIKENNIETAGLCTSCNNDIFFSYRRENPTGRFAVGAMIK